MNEKRQEKDDQPYHSQDQRLDRDFGSKLARAYSALPPDQRTVTRLPGSDAPVSNPELEEVFENLLKLYQPGEVGKRDDVVDTILGKELELQVAKEQAREDAAGGQHAPRIEAGQNTEIKPMAASHGGVKRHPHRDYRHVLALLCILLLLVVAQQWQSWRRSSSSSDWRSRLGSSKTEQASTGVSPTPAPQPDRGSLPLVQSDPEFDTTHFPQPPAAAKTMRIPAVSPNPNRTTVTQPLASPTSELASSTATQPIGMPSASPDAWATAAAAAVASPAAANPDAPLYRTQRIKVPEVEELSRLVHKVNPEYPLVARNARIQGTVVLRTLVGKDGSIEMLTVMTGHPFLIPGALNAVKSWQFKPYSVGDDVVEVETTITVNFKNSE